VAGSPWPDLVVRDKATKKAYVVRTGGQTNFQRGRRAIAGWKGMDLIAATHDLTGDGVPDMVARNATTLMTGVFPGTPQGGFGAPVLDTTRFRAADQVTGVLDLTGDGNNDLVARMGAAKSLWLFPGNGHGGFKKRRRLSADWGSYNRTVGVGDLTGDGKNDLLARRAGRLYLVPGVGRRIGTPTLLARGWGRFSIIAGAGDLTNDGVPDVVVKNAKTRLVSIFPGNGSGRLGRPLGPFGQFKNLNYIAAVGQLTGDPGTDLVGRNGKGGMFVFPNNGGRNIETVTNTGIALRGTNLILNVGDWNSDGKGDIVTRTAKTGNLYLRPGDGTGRFGSRVLLAKGWGGVRLVAAVGDITGDGHPDLMGQPARAAMRIYPGDGATGFLPSYVAHSAISSNGHSGLGLWDGDGSPDSLLRRGDGTLRLYPGNGPGGLMNSRKIGAGAKVYDWLQSVGDATGDGRPDVVARESATGKLWLLPGAGNGFGARRIVAFGFGRYDLSS